MIRFFTLVTFFLVLEGCQSTANRGKPRENQPERNLGPKFDDADVPDSTSKPGTLPSQDGNGQTGTGTPKDPNPSTEQPSKAVVISEVSPENHPQLPFGSLEMTGGEPSWVIARDQYVLSWNPSTRNPNWVAWKLSESDLGSIGRQDNFSIDPVLNDYIRDAGSDVKPVTTSEYSGSCFDRGHMVASADRQSSSEDNLPTFYTTNIIPQTAFLNQKIWAGLENEARKWITDGVHKNLWIVSGPIYEKTLHYTGPNSNIAIPSANFKLVYSWDEHAADKAFLVKAILVPNMTSQGKIAYEDKTELCAEAKTGGQVKGVPILKSIKYDDYQATIPEIEAAARIRFPKIAP